MTTRFEGFKGAIQYAKDCLRNAPVIHSGYWQGVDISNMPEAATHEVLHFSFKCPLPERAELLEEIGADLPWAEEHFLERVSGQPLNPPPSEERWPHAPKGQVNSKFKKNYDGDGVLKFSHSYPERMWPSPDLSGQRFRYGNTNDVVALIAADPLTRQAFLPIWWPEDGGSPINERKPCTLGYHFIIRPDSDGVPRLDVTYYIRSCDFKRHFRNDIYLTVQLALWMIGSVKLHSDTMGLERQGKFLSKLKPGNFIMHITSLHLFRNDYHTVFGR